LPDKMNIQYKVPDLLYFYISAGVVDCLLDHRTLTPGFRVPWLYLAL